MKKLALTNLIVLMTIKSVSACSVSYPDYDSSAENYFYIKVYFYSSLAMILGIIILFFLRGKKGLWLIFTELTGIWLAVFTAISVLFAAFILFGSVWTQDCGRSLRFTLGSFFIILLTLFFLQFASWIGQVKIPFKLL